MRHPGLDFQFSSLTPSRAVRSLRQGDHLAACVSSPARKPADGTDLLGERRLWRMGPCPVRGVVPNQQEGSSEGGSPVLPPHLSPNAPPPREGPNPVFPFTPRTTPMGFLLQEQCRSETSVPKSTSQRLHHPILLGTSAKGLGSPAPLRGLISRLFLLADAPHHWSTDTDGF